MHSHGIPMISISIGNGTISKVFRIGDSMEEVSDGNNSEPFTGTLKGVQLEPHINRVNTAHASYDNIATFGYMNPDCALARISAEDYDVERLVLMNASGEYRVIDAHNIKTLKLFDDEQQTWIDATEEDILSFISEINNPSITSIHVDDEANVIDVIIDNVEDLDIGLVAFLTGIEGITSVTYQGNSQSYQLILGDEATYDTFKKGVISSMPTTNNETMNGVIQMSSANGAQLVYTLKVTYFNQDDEFKKLDAYLGGYTGEDATVAKTEDKKYTVTGHVPEKTEFVFDPLTAISTIKNLSKVKVTAGGESQEITDFVSNGTALMDFLKAKIPFEVSYDNVEATIELTAGETTATYTLVFGTDYDQVETADAIIEGYYESELDSESVNITKGGADGITWLEVKLKKAPEELVDDLGFKDMIKSIPYLKNFALMVGESRYELSDPDDPEQWSALHEAVMPGMPVNTESGDVASNIWYSFTNTNPAKDVKTGTMMNMTSLVKPAICTVDGKGYPTVAEAVAAIENGTPKTIDLLGDVTEDITIPVGKDITIKGTGSNTLNGVIVCTAAGAENTNLTVENLTMDGAGTMKYGIRSQNQTDNDQMELNLTLNNVIMTGYTAKGIYTTNAKTLTINGGSISNCATGEMDDPNTKGDYAVDLNLVAVQNAVVKFNGVTFAGDLGDNAAVKVTARGGASDAGAADIPKGVGEATVDSVTFDGCNFDGCTTDVKYRIGTENKTGGDAVNTTGKYAVSLVNNTEMKVRSVYLAEPADLVVPVGRSATKTAEGDLALDPTAEEKIDEIINGLTGVDVVEDPETPNTFSITTSTGSLSGTGLFDQLAAIDGVTSIAVSNGSTTETYTAGGDLEAFKTAVDAMIPASNDIPTATLTVTVTM